MYLKIDIEKILETLITDFNVEEKDIVVASDCHVGYFTISKIYLFLGTFNSTLVRKLFSILDETATFIGSIEVYNLLKSFITQDL